VVVKEEREYFPIYQKFSPSDADFIKWALVNVAQERALQPAEIELLLRNAHDFLPDILRGRMILLNLLHFNFMLPIIWPMKMYSL